MRKSLVSSSSLSEQVSMLLVILKENSMSMADNEAGLTTLKESETEEEPFAASDEDEYIPEPADIEYEKSGVEKEPVIEQEEEYDSDESNKEEPALTQPAVFVGKDRTEWRDTLYPQAQAVNRNVMRQKGGPTTFSALFTARETFKSIMSHKICDIILRETYQKGRKLDKPSGDTFERIPVVGSCTICRQLNQRQRKTRNLHPIERLL
ncbi:hypothetical protein ILUMI_16952 [Ignelater luminosus]|uniref:Uncharacterized protein n=1 Tax=Ignelater luminosus TaxID=2038154 RepID=A0A8K0CP97_IGNLU|nr:hypothetical protein ILUMI_16952 [Ignelater luminosus]